MQHLFSSAFSNSKKRLCFLGHFWFRIGSEVFPRSRGGKRRRGIIAVNLRSTVWRPGEQFNEPNRYKHRQSPRTRPTDNPGPGIIPALAIVLSRISANDYCQLLALIIATARITPTGLVFPALFSFLRFFNNLYFSRGDNATGKYALQFVCCGQTRGREEKMDDEERKRREGEDCVLHSSLYSVK